MPRRDDLPPLERAVSDTLDEWLVRMHGVTSSHSFPQEFLTWLREGGYEVIAADELAALRQEVEQLRVAVNPTKADAVKSLVRSATRLVRIERDDARAAIARVKALAEAWVALPADDSGAPAKIYAVDAGRLTLAVLDGAGAVSEKQTGDGHG